MILGVPRSKRPPRCWRISGANSRISKGRLAVEENINFEALFRLKDAEDAVAGEVLQHCIEVWSALTVSLIHAYGPELVLFGGAVMRSGEEIFDPVRGWVARHIWRATRGIPRIETATLAMMALCFEQKLFFERNTE